MTRADKKNQLQVVTILGLTLASEAAHCLPAFVCIRAPYQSPLLLTGPPVFRTPLGGVSLVGMIQETIARPKPWLFLRYLSIIQRA